jgi:hypothetical protein
MSARRLSGTELHRAVNCVTLESLKFKTRLNQVKFCRTADHPAISPLLFAIGHWRLAMSSEPDSPEICVPGLVLKALSAMQAKAARPTTRRPQTKTT